MKRINLITQEGVRLTYFPDNHPHLQVLGIEEGDDVEVIVSLKDANHVLYLLEIADALDGIGAAKCQLTISYLMAARYDRVMHAGDSLDLRVIAKLINSCGFGRVEIFDPHSDVALALIERSRAITNEALVKTYDKPDAILVCPDAGAVKKVEKYSFWNPLIKNAIFCTKTRNLQSGAVSLRVLDPHDDCHGENVVIIDDICDGGATFLAIANQIVSPKSLTLIVSHGIFSKGLRALKERFDEIITTDSYQYQNPEPKLRVVKMYGN